VAGVFGKKGEKRQRCHMKTELHRKKTALKTEEKIGIL
jgi:hypothetical protein